MEVAKASTVDDEEVAVVVDVGGENASATETNMKRKDNDFIIVAIHRRHSIVRMMQVRKGR
jgi:hypothetical protein